MSEEAMRAFSRAFCSALAARKPEQLAPFLDDAIDWMVFGPVDLLPLFGARHGKQSVLALCGEIAAYLRLQGCEQETTVSDGENAAAMMRLSALHIRSGRILSLRLALFARFRDQKLARLRVLFDSLDFAEQAMGRQIGLEVAG